MTLFLSEKFKKEYYFDNFCYHIYEKINTGYEKTEVVKCKNCQSRYFIKIKSADSYNWHCYGCGSFYSKADSSIKTQDNPNLESLIPAQGIKLSGDSKAVKQYNKAESGYIFTENPQKVNKAAVTFSEEKPAAEPFVLIEKSITPKISRDELTELVREKLDMEQILRNKQNSCGGHDKPMK